jgi:hypothetical protein
MSYTLGLEITKAPLLNFIENFPIVQIVRPNLIFTLNLKGNFHFHFH